MEKIQEKDVSPVRLAFRTGYLGGYFYGSQMQGNERTVEGEFIAACKRSNLFSDFREARFLAAGRTDRGVHARGQVFAFTTDFPERAVSSLNWQLPKDIWVTGYAEVDTEFHPRYRAFQRTYRYYFGDGGLDQKGMEEAANLFRGCHDFSRFARVCDKDPVRNVLAAGIFNDGRLVCFEVTAESFLWHMVRYMASALLQVGRGDWMAHDIELQLAGEGPSRALSPAPPGHLVLWEVDYGMPFLPIPSPGRSRDFLVNLRDDYEVMARICTLFEKDMRPGDEFPL